MARSRNSNRGRPRKPGPREPNGKPQRESKAQGIDPTIETMLHREALVEGAFDRPRDSLPGHTLGILKANRIISEDQYNAAIRLERLSGALRAALGAKWPHPRVGSYGQPNGHTAASERVIALLREQYDLAVRELGSSMPAVRDVLNTIVCGRLPSWFKRRGSRIGVSDNLHRTRFVKCLDNLAVYWREKRAA